MEPELLFERRFYPQPQGAVKPLDNHELLLFFSALYNVNEIRWFWLLSPAQLDIPVFLWITCELTVNWQWSIRYRLKFTLSKSAHQGINSSYQHVRRDNYFLSNSVEPLFFEDSLIYWGGLLRIARPIRTILEMVGKRSRNCCTATQFENTEAVRWKEHFSQATFVVSELTAFVHAWLQPTAAKCWRDVEPKAEKNWAPSWSLFKRTAFPA